MKEPADKWGQTPIERYFKRHYKELCALAYSYVHDAQKAQDLVQDIFVRLLVSKDSLDSIDNVRAYLYKATIHRSINEIKSVKKRKAHIEKATRNKFEPFVSVEDHMIYAEQRIEIYRAIDQLPTQCRRVFVHCCLRKMKYKEAAKEMDISINSVKTQMKIAFKRLRSSLEGLRTK